MIQHTFSFRKKMTYQKSFPSFTNLYYVKNCHLHERLCHSFIIFINFILWLDHKIP
jgi:hypothetical protein